MLQSVGSYLHLVPNFIEKGLAHPSFLGRALSWGVFYGTFAIVTQKVAIYSQPYLKKLWDSSREKLGYQIEKVPDDKEKTALPTNVAMISHGKNQYFISLIANFPPPVHTKTEEPYVDVNEDLEGKSKPIQKVQEPVPITTESLTNSLQSAKQDSQKKNKGYFG